MNKNIVEEIRAKTDIVELVSQYVVLKKAGRSFKGLCPFHKEKTPSFIVSPDKQLAYCFGCQKGGDAFEFIMEVERVDFSEAIRFLAEKNGMDISGEQIRVINKSEKDILFEIMNTATKFYQKNLEENQTATEYVNNRKLNNEIITKFQIGYAPDSYDKLWKYLLESMKFKTEDIQKVGLLSFSEKNFYDKFRDRIIFPIHNPLGQIVAFVGRILAKGEPKYLNSPETPIYHKGNTLYGLYFAKESIKEQDQVIIVEGQMDFLTAFQNDITNIVASSGTAFTKEQVQTLSRFTKNFYFLFDNDSAGWSATLRNAELCIPLDINIIPLDLTKYKVKDLDEFFQKYSKDDLKELQSKSKKFFDHLIDKFKTLYDIKTIEGKKIFINNYLTYLNLIPNAPEKEYYAKQLATELGVSLDAMLNEIKKYRAPKIHENISSQSPVNKIKYNTPDSIFIGIICNYPDLYSEFKEKIFFTKLEGEIENYVYNIITNEYNFEGKFPDIFGLLEKENKQRLEVLLLYVDEQNITSDMEVARKTLIEKLQILHERLKRTLVMELNKYQKDKDFDKWKETFSKLQQISR